MLAGSGRGVRRFDKDGFPLLANSRTAKHVGYYVYKAPEGEDVDDGMGDGVEDDDSG